MSTARPYFSRAARYVYRASDQSLLRFATMDSRGDARSAVIRDLSDSGLSFTLERNEPTPEEGDLLKVELPIPGRKSIACFATVMRVESRSEWDPEWGDRGHILVALQFRHLPTLHLRAIQEGLKGRVGSEESFDWSYTRRAHGFAFAGLTLALGLSLWLMAQTPEAWLRLL